MFSGIAAGMTSNETCAITPVLEGAGAPKRLPSRPPNRGRTERRMRDASAASCAIKTSARASHHGYVGHIRRSARGEVMACFASPPVSVAGTTVSRRRGPPRQDHATWAIRRSDAVRRLSSTPSADLHRLPVRSISDNRTLRREPPHPAPRQVTIASRPQEWDGMNRNIYLNT
jgi:hypothetical protein